MDWVVATAQPQDFERVVANIKMWLQQLVCVYEKLKRFPESHKA